MWGNNPFTSYSPMPYGSSQGWQSSNSPWTQGQSSQSGQFNAGALNFGQGAWPSGMLGTTPQVDPNQGNYANMGGGLGFGGNTAFQSPQGGMPNRPRVDYFGSPGIPTSTDPTSNMYGAQPGGNLGMPQQPAAAAPNLVQNPASYNPQAGGPAGVNFAYGQGPGMQGMSALMAKMLYGATPPQGNNNATYNPGTGQWM